ncbi:hypothetical protein [Lacipirellula parvula]|uniref:Uncharacterized protein n=1 Tax=Lacipirellula parvula TaxID=2650471 RepID=A0A5K7XB06_9BACT|nr:hypothetical protein [Lacipirellula parvula]BBO31991.1 hypothetical protein PLANPX_1603 [Lacipirellula parvula]
MDQAEQMPPRNLRAFFLRVGVALLFVGALVEFIAFSQLYRVTSRQSALRRIQGAKAMLNRPTVPPGGKLVRKPDGSYGVLLAPRTIAHGVTVTESYSSRNVYKSLSKEELEQNELESKRLLLTPIASALAIPPVAGLVLVLIFARTPCLSAIAPTEPAATT